MKVPTLSRRSVIDEQLTPTPRRQASIKLYDGSQRSTSHWDGLRRDSELWLEDGDCLVHFYGFGASRRGPSLRLSSAALEACASKYLLQECFHQRDASSPISPDDSASDSGYASSHCSKVEPAPYELFIPVPGDLTREQSYTYHLTTRNFFAYLVGKPIVGEHLGSALANLLERIRQWQPRTAALANLMEYCEKQGYLDMAENPDYALACLCLAEEARLRDLWKESFVHCVGMHDRLYLSREFQSLSNTTKALITRASLEMDLHTARVIRALGSFLEEQLGAEHLGLSKPARDHLDRFRSCLHNYYVDKLGYFPPDEEAPWNKPLWTKMYHAFQHLYEYLVDTESNLDPTNMRGLNGGICVTQNVQAFDQRHGYTPLPHPLPLLPDTPTNARRASDGQKGLRTFKLGRGDAAAGELRSSREALARSTNSDDEEIVGSALVQEYQRFERQRLEEKLPVAEARKVRWLLIYGVLQMLISITRAPKEVRDTETPSYPLCVLTAGLPPWLEAEAANSHVASSPRAAHLMTSQFETPKAEEEEEDRLSIHPDCEADNAENYFSSQNASPRASTYNLELTPSPLRITTQISRTASIRSSVHSGVHALHKSFVGSLTRRNTTRRSIVESPLSKSSSYCEILVEGYGNGADSMEETESAKVMWTPDSFTNARRSDPFAGFDFGLEHVSEEPVLEDFHLDGNVFEDYKPLPAVPTSIERVQSESCLSALASDRSSSTRSSTYIDCDSPATELSSCDELSRRDSNPKSEFSPIEPSSAESYPPRLQKRHSYQQKHLNFGVRSACFSVNAGCYVPTGRPVDMPLSKFSQRREPSSASVDSSASSEYGENSTQADDIEEEELRGRRRSRGLDRIRPEEMYAEGKRISLEEEQ